MSFSGIATYKLQLERKYCSWTHKWQLITEIAVPWPHISISMQCLLTNGHITLRCLTLTHTFKGLILKRIGFELIHAKHKAIDTWQQLRTKKGGCACTDYLVIKLNLRAPTYIGYPSCPLDTNYPKPAQPMSLSITSRRKLLKSIKSPFLTNLLIFLHQLWKVCWQ